MALNTLLSSQLLASPQPVAARQFNVAKDGEMTGQATPDIRDERRFDRGSWIALAYTLVVFVYSAAEIVYGLSLPYDGWAITWGPDSTGAAIEVRFEFNGQDQPSNLRPGDLLVAIDGKPVTQRYAESLTLSRLRPPNWPDGHILHYTVRRAGELLTVAVPVHYHSLLDYQAGWLRRDAASHLAQVISSWLFFGLGVFVFFRRPREPAAHALLLMGTGFFFQWLSTPDGDNVTHLFEPLTSVVFRAFNYWTNAIVPSLAYLILAFPTPKWPLRPFPRLTLALLFLPYTPAVILCYLLLRQDPAAFLQALLIVNVSPLLWIPPTLLMFIHSSFMVREPLARAQMKWLAFGMGGFIVIGISAWLVDFAVPLGEALGFVVRLASALGWLMLPVCLAIAILRYRLFDIDIIINRALVYGTLTTLVIGLYVFAVGYLGAIFHTETNLFISLAATGVVAVLFQPLRNRLQRGVNRLMYGQRDEPVAVLSQLGARLEGTLTPDEILPNLVDIVTRALKLPYAAIALQVGDQLKVQAENGQPSDSLETFPFIYQGQPIGQLWIAPRSPGEAFNPADRLLLTNIARQAGAVAHAVQLTAALQQSRQQLVTAREEERRRLRRDLHDGLGPQLASQTLTLNAIGKLLERDPAKARELLSHLQTQSQAAIEDIRRLVYALRPPALDELGLVEALREGARQYEQAGGCAEIITEPQPLPALPAAVEVAVYRIAQEAITNVIRHTQAKTCRIDIMARNQHLELTIADDGPGFRPDAHFGVGLNSMRERTEELGGRLGFDNQPEGGARVQVWLPLPGEEA